MTDERPLASGSSFDEEIGGASPATTPGTGYDQLIDEVAAVCASDSIRRITDLYSRPELRVPAELIQ